MNIEEIKIYLQNNYFKNDCKIDLIISLLIEKYESTKLTANEFIASVKIANEIHEQFKYNYECSNCGEKLTYEDYHNQNCFLCEIIEEIDKENKE